MPLTVTGSGFSPNTDYVVKITNAQGHVGIKNVKTDGSGNFTFNDVPQVIGLVTYDARPLNEMNGTTTPTATVQGKVKK